MHAIQRVENKRINNIVQRAQTNCTMHESSTSISKVYKQNVRTTRTIKIHIPSMYYQNVLVPKRTPTKIVLVPKCTNKNYKHVYTHKKVPKHIKRTSQPKNVSSKTKTKKKCQKLRKRPTKRPEKRRRAPFSRRHQPCYSPRWRHCFGIPKKQGCSPMRSTTPLPQSFRPRGECIIIGVIDEGHPHKARHRRSAKRSNNIKNA